MATRRDALVKAGLAKPGRGKFSTDANAWLDAQRAKGVTFDDDNGPVKNVTKSSDKPTTAPVKPEGVGYPDYVFPSDYRYPEDEYTLTFPKGFPYPAKTVGLRNVCDTCKVSLVNHLCDSPRLFGYAVTIERRKSST